MGNPDVLLRVVTGYRYSQRHQRFYAGGTRRYLADGTTQRTLSMSFHCPCGDPLYDGDPCCLHGGRVVPIHINCGTDQP